MIAFVHIQSLRLASGDEALVARVLARDGRAGYGFSLRLDAAEARHMAEWHAGVRVERPTCVPLLGHPWEKAWLSKNEITWNAEPGFTQLRWLP